MLVKWRVAERSFVIFRFSARCFLYLASWTLLVTVVGRPSISFLSWTASISCLSWTALYIMLVMDGSLYHVYHVAALYIMSIMGQLSMSIMDGCLCLSWTAVYIMSVMRLLSISRTAVYIMSIMGQVSISCPSCSNCVYHVYLIPGQFLCPSGDTAYIHTFLVLTKQIVKTIH